LVSVDIFLLSLACSVEVYEIPSLIGLQALLLHITADIFKY